MSALRLTLREAPPGRLDLSPLTPSGLAGKDLKAIAALELRAGGERHRVDALFALKGKPGEDLVLAGTTGRCDGIGAGLSAGSIEVEGDAGDGLGRGMGGGTIRVQGGVAAFAASGMTGGEIRIAGDAGDFLAAAVPGEHRGMKGGLVLVQGSAGERAGDRMRRGMLLIAGDTGAFCASRMVAGTIAVGGLVGPGSGTAMRRGTLLLPELPPGLPPTFNDCGAFPLTFLTLLSRSWRGLPAPFGEFPDSALRVRRLMGDLANDGRGEILVRVG